MGRVILENLAKVPGCLRESIARSKAEYRRLGDSGLRVSNPILGGLSLGSSRWLPWVLDEDKALGILKTAYDNGINTWDTANVYSNGESERVMGKALKKYNIPRQKVVIMTKCFRVLCDPENFHHESTVTMHHEAADRSKDYVNQWGLSRKAIFSAVEGSLERLNTSYIDVLQIHRFDPTVSPKETMRALDDLVRAGMIHYIGASSMWAHEFAMLQTVAKENGWTQFISMQNHYNLIYREEEREMNPYCRLTGVGLIPWAPLASGRLARDPTESSTTSKRAGTSKLGSIYDTGEDVIPDKIIMRVKEVAMKRGWPMSHVGLAWLNKRVTAPVLGFSSEERILEALSARGKVLSDEEERYLEELYRPRAIQGHS
ncbi:NADP-dependent oxidoreductase domain-containing protein [Xylaria bambusicola]|uniref:NADP-dependent oxidoreductase domain-containing protein n=1 Tax=Xylaria bambusicola TaxID=326684 RepID=UPI002007C452|nr:NADP-dependent oxidoreductase domain-containing protein [Xylaria bambusicola]KAI0512859.1 NADP-dependent oxidoreductase domain-containing protein [Xylaria bambusicola]